MIRVTRRTRATCSLARAPWPGLRDSDCLKDSDGLGRTWLDSVGRQLGVARPRVRAAFRGQRGTPSHGPNHAVVWYTRWLGGASRSRPSYGLIPVRPWHGSVRFIPNHTMVWSRCFGAWYGSAGVSRSCTGSGCSQTRRPASRCRARLRRIYIMIVTVIKMAQLGILH